MQKKYIIIDIENNHAIRDVTGKTMLFNTYLAAEEVAYCDLCTDYIIVEVIL